MTNEQTILDISKRLELTHIGSNLSCLPILEEIYQAKNARDIVILDNAHAHLAHLVVKGENVIHDQFGPAMPGDSIEDTIKRYGIHCDRQAGCDASGGSLGHGIGIGIGYALADPTRHVYVIVSDGSMMEGSNWEALRIANNLHPKNLHIHGNFNGYSALAPVNILLLYKRMKSHAPKVDIVDWQTTNGEGFRGMLGHYKKL